MGTIKGRVAHVQARVDSATSDIADLKGMIAALDAMIAALDAKWERRFDALGRRFLWMIGIQVTTLVTIAGGLFGVLTKLL